MNQPRLLILNMAMDEDDPILWFTTRWAYALAQGFHEVDVITMRASRLEPPDNVHVFSLGKEQGLGKSRRAMRFYSKLTELMAAHRYSMIFAHMTPHFAIMATPMAKLTRTPMVMWYAHGAPPPLVVRTAARCVDLVVTSSAAGFKLDSAKRLIVGQGIDTELFRPGSHVAKPKVATILVVGRIGPVKNCDLALETIAELSRRHSGALRARFIGPVLPGDETYAERMHRYAATMGLDDQVSWVGNLDRDALALEYQRATLMLHTCTNGALDKVVLESMASGVPVVTTSLAYGDVFSQSDLDKNLFVPTASAATLGDAMERLLAMSDEDRATLGAELRDFVVRQHSLEQWTKRLSADVFGRLSAR